MGAASSTTRTPHYQHLVLHTALLPSQLPIDTHQAAREKTGCQQGCAQISKYVNEQKAQGH